MTGARPQAAKLEEIFGRHPTKALIANLHTAVERLEIGGLSVPITVNDGHRPGNCYICNPVTGYIDYAIEETRNFISHPALRGTLTGLIRAVSPIVRASGMDRAVHVNNWLFSTNPAPRIDRQTAVEIRETLVPRFRGHTIILRSLNTFADHNSLQALQAEGFQLLPSRQVYLFDGRSPPPPGKDLKRDLRLLRTTPHEVVTNDAFTPGDYSRCATLYRMLYLDKYTPLNPQYTAEFIATLHRGGLLQLEGLRARDGTLVAFGGRFQYGETLTQPLLGYDTGRPRKEGLYRLISVMAQQHAMDNALLFNMSAGAAAFKRHRGARPAIEFSAIYNRHLPRRQRMAQWGVARLLSTIGIPLLKRFEL